jgi:hypothetical protein
MIFGRELTISESLIAIGMIVNEKTQDFFNILIRAKG